MLKHGIKHSVLAFYNKAFPMYMIEVLNIVKNLLTKEKACCIMQLMIQLINCIILVKANKAKQTKRGEQIE